MHVAFLAVGKIAKVTLECRRSAANSFRRFVRKEGWTGGERLNHPITRTMNKQIRRVGGVSAGRKSTSNKLVGVSLKSREKPARVPAWGKALAEGGSG